MSQTRTDPWTQEPLFPPDAIELVMRWGFVPSADHAQLQWSITNATDGTLLRLEAMPHRPISATMHESTQMVRQALKALHELLDPFPA